MSGDLVATQFCETPDMQQLALFHRCAKFLTTESRQLVVSHLCADCLTISRYVSHCLVLRGPAEARTQCCVDRDSQPRSIVPLPHVALARTNSGRLYIFDLPSTLILAIASDVCSVGG